MARRGCTLILVGVSLVGGCATAEPGTSPTAPGPAPSSSSAPDATHRWAAKVLAHYDRAIEATGGLPFMPIAGLTGTIGAWEPAVGDNNKRALDAGLISAAGPLPAAPAAPGVVTWVDGNRREVPLISAARALDAIDSNNACADCTPLSVTGARPTTIEVETTHGMATAPAWEYMIRGSAVRVTRIAVARSAMTEVPRVAADADRPEFSRPVVSATPTGTQLAVALVGARGPASEPCGADYTAEAVESEHAVTVIITERRHPEPAACALMGHERRVVADLAEPLDGRAVVDLREGHPVPVRAG